MNKTGLAMVLLAFCIGCAGKHHSEKAPRTAQYHPLTLDDLAKSDDAEFEFSGDETIADPYPSWIQYQMTKNCGPTKFSFKNYESPKLVGIDSKTAYDQGLTCFDVSNSEEYKDGIRTLRTWCVPEQDPRASKAQVFSLKVADGPYPRVALLVNVNFVDDTYCIIKGSVLPVKQ